MKNITLVKPQASKSSLDSAASFESLNLIQWKSLASRAHRPSTARVIVKCLDEQPRLREVHIGTYIVAMEAIKLDQIRYAQWRRVGLAAGATYRLAAGLVAKTWA